MVFTIISGLAIGVIFGFALQRGRFCMNSAFRDPLVFKDFTLLKAVGLALGIELVGFYVLNSIGLIEYNPKLFYWLAVPLGAYVFGVGMAIAGGCASGTAYRVGEGMIGSWLALFGFVGAAYLAKDGILSGLTAVAQSYGLGSLTLGSITGLPNIFWIAFFSVLIFWLLFGQKRNKIKYSVPKDERVGLISDIFKKGWSWQSAGLAIGLIGLLAFVFSSLSGRNYALGITMGFETILKSIIRFENFLTWESFEVIGLVFGAFLGSFIAGEFKFRFPRPRIAWQSLAGGVLMGFGAVVADGCNIGHILSGIPQLAISSLVAGIFIILGGWTMAYFLFIRNN